MDINCGRCPKTWRGLSKAHCATCHETFGSVRSFDRHRTNGHCAEPATLGLTLNGKRGVFAGLSSTRT